MHYWSTRGSYEVAELYLHACRSETVSGRSSPSDSHSDVDSIGNLETDSVRHSLCND